MNQYMNIRIDMRSSTPKDEDSMTKQYQYPSIVSVSRCFTLVPDYCMTTSSILPIRRHNNMASNQQRTNLPATRLKRTFGV